jgi:hypothetical protein
MHYTKRRSYKKRTYKKGGSKTRSLKSKKSSIDKTIIEVKELIEIGPYIPRNPRNK